MSANQERRIQKIETRIDSMEKRLKDFDDRIKKLEQTNIRRQSIRG